MRAISCSLAVSLLLLAGCKRSAAADDDLCAKLASFADGGVSAAGKDRCQAELAALGPNMRTCVSACVSSAKTYDDYEDCKDDCTGTPLPAFLVCQKITSDGQLFDACEKSHSALMQRDPAKYKCWTRCGRRASGPAAAACDGTCGIP